MQINMTSEYNEPKYIPLQEQTDGRQQNRANGSSKGLVLLVDDEKALLDLGEKVLNTIGYDAITALNGQEALDRYNQYSDIVDLVILDMIMPVMNGRDCFIRLKAVNPELPIIILSGFCDDNDKKELLSKGCIGFIKKPYSIVTLRQMVENTLEN